jgi:hypothetical protein
MAELFGEEEEPKIVLHLPPSKPKNDQGEPSSTIPCMSSLETGNSTTRNKTITKSEFLLQYPALMDPRNFLRLITKFPISDIITWGNFAQPREELTRMTLRSIENKVFKLMGERAPGGMDLLKQVLEVARAHNRLDIGKHRYKRGGTDLVFSDMDAWYEAISNNTTSDVARLPLYYYTVAAASEQLTLLLGSSGLQPLSVILHDLLYDPLFPHSTLQDIADHALLEFCTMHSYAHAVEKLKVNSPYIRTTQEDVKNRVEELITARILWVPVAGQVPPPNTEQDATPDTQTGDTYLNECNKCVVDGATDCRIRVFGRVTRSWQPLTIKRKAGQQCTRCEDLGQVCEDRSIKLPIPTAAPKDFAQDYRTLQRTKGHIVEKAKEFPGLAAKLRHELRAQVLVLLPAGTSRQDGHATQRSIRSRDESKLQSLIEKMAHPCDANSQMDEDASLQARLLSQKGVAHDSDEEMHDEKEEDEHEDAEESDDEDMDGDAWNARVTALSKTGYMMSL